MKDERLKDGRLKDGDGRMNALGQKRGNGVKGGGGVTIVGAEAEVV